MDYSRKELNDIEYSEEEVHEESEYLQQESEYETQYVEEAKGNKSDMGPLGNS